MNLALTETCQLVRSRGPGGYRGSIGPPDACVIRRCRRLAALSRLCLEAIAAGRSNGRIRVQDILQQAQQYLVLVINKDNAHYDMATILGRRHWRLGVPVIITTTVVSTAIFSTLTEETAMGWRIATGLISVAAAVLAALQPSSASLIKLSAMLKPQEDIPPFGAESSASCSDTGPKQPVENRLSRSSRCSRTSSTSWRRLDHR
jgi:pheromone shutdown protein TraB